MEAERAQARNSNENPTRHGNGEHDGSGLTLWAEDAAYSALVQRMRDDPNRRSAARQAQYQAASSLLSDRYRATRGLFHDRYLASQRLLATNGYLAWEMLTNQYHASQRLLTDQNSAARRLLTDRHPAAWRRLPVRRLLPARRLLAVSTGIYMKRKAPNTKRRGDCWSTNTKRRGDCWPSEQNLSIYMTRKAPMPISTTVSMTAHTKVTSLCHSMDRR